MDVVLSQTLEFMQHLKLLSEVRFELRIHEIRTLTTRIGIGLSETLHAEICPIGLRSICIDFGYFRTSFLNAEHRMPHVGKIADYKEVTEAYERDLQGEYRFYCLSLCILTSAC